MRVVIRAIAGASCGGVGGVADLDVVIEDHPVGVVDDLGFVAELDGLAQTSLADRTGIDVVQAHHPGRRLGHHPGQAATGLGHNAFGGSHDGLRRLIARAAGPCGARSHARSARRALRITAVASRMAASAIPASSPVIRRTAAWA